MLMSSALSCDTSQPPMTRLQASLFASPPASPPLSTQSTIGNIFTTCRALQSILTTPATNSDRNTTQLLSPPMANTTLSPLKLRLRSRKTDTNGDFMAPKRIVKRSAPAPRGLKKRRRGVEDDIGRDDDVESDLDIENNDSCEEDKEAICARPSTPKRARIAPEQIPLGLERSDFHNLHTSAENESKAEGTGVEVEADGETWSTEDDRILVELVLEKLKLSKTDWQECARSLGKDRSSIGRRWKSLMVNGDVGLKTRSRRSKIHGTWR
ncbi:uncharacterized protein BCR38DRAFT_429935 [Pseudomassariella vexata]|uniref:Myb-like domain-containing protein n=1 Tax=Pseudomassariella vexata TaxID=1141098 RepID=A0A1Y2E4W4_9PEZI|nr:uncharacterized protein BCR38DRAFT_429935 [Pseudomassariella vexata]ORY66336.1 hypothetical protein BCR38DRAFT_429935 [Pseudomassariella vexata]